MKPTLFSYKRTKRYFVFLVAAFNVVERLRNKLVSDITYITTAINSPSIRIEVNNVTEKVLKTFV